MGIWCRREGWEGGGTVVVRGCAVGEDWRKASVGAIEGDRELKGRTRAPRLVKKSVQPVGESPKSVVSLVAVTVAEAER